MSHVRPRTNGPRSITFRVAHRFLQMRTIVPSGSVLCATPQVRVVRIVPSAVRLPYRPGPYQLAIACPPECASARAAQTSEAITAIINGTRISASHALARRE